MKDGNIISRSGHVWTSAIRQGRLLMASVLTVFLMSSITKQELQFM